MLLYVKHNGGGATPLSSNNEDLDTIVDRNYNSNMKNYRLRKGFTLAEVLITLAIVGIVAALTIPTVSKNIQHAVLKNQFKKFYSTFTQAISAIQAKNGRPVKCYYWDISPYDGKCTPVCSLKNEYGTCIGGYICEETGEPTPSDFNGAYSECSEFYEELFLNTLKTSKICENNAYEQGCLPKDFRGADVAKSEQSPDQEYDPNALFSDSNIKNVYPVIVLFDGTYIIKYFSMTGGNPIFTVDINGFKGPNKWGYDIFSFTLRGSANNGIQKLKTQTYATEKGGKTFEQMYNECFN